MCILLSELVPLKMQEDELEYLLIHYLKSWTEIPLERNARYDKNELLFYDGFIGMVLKRAEELVRYQPEYLNDELIRSFLYQGKLYRVIHPCRIDDRRCKQGFRYGLPKVDYHGMITHWTKDRTFESLRHKLSCREKYIILEADTKDRVAFDINKFRKNNGIIEQFTQDEEEVIFPMYKDYITEYRMSIEQFNEIKIN